MVSAIELYNFLGYGENNWVRWYKVNITENPFALENVDFTSLLLKRSENSKGNFGLDFLITIDFAKKLCMQARTEKGEEARNYFLKCEKELLQITQNPIPQTPSETSNNGMEEKFDLLVKAITKNENTLTKICDVQMKFFEKLTNYDERFEVLESEVAQLKNKFLILEEHISQKNIFVLMVIFDKQENYHKIFTKENPVFQVENQTIYFEQSEVLFSIEFEQKSECKKMEKSIFNILKMQNAHICNDYFELKPHHFQMFATLKMV